MVRRAAVAVGLLVAAALVAACRPDTVALAFRPQAGDRYEYRYEIEATITQALDGGRPTVTEIATTLETMQRVLEVSPGSVRAEITVRRDGGAPRRNEVRLDRAGSLQGVDLIQGQRADVFGLGELSGVMATLPLPEEMLAPGDRWRLDEDPFVGEGRLVRLGVVDGDDVAVIATDATQSLDDTVPTQATTAALTGQLRARGTTAYSLRDGSLRRSTTRARGAVVARIEPPPGVSAAPVVGDITYDIRIRVTRQR